MSLRVWRFLCVVIVPLALSLVLFRPAFTAVGHLSSEDLDTYAGALHTGLVGSFDDPFLYDLTFVLKALLPLSDFEILLVTRIAIKTIDIWVYALIAYELSGDLTIALFLTLFLGTSAIEARFTQGVLRNAFSTTMTLLVVFLVSVTRRISRCDVLLPLVLAATVLSHRLGGGFTLIVFATYALIELNPERTLRHFATIAACAVILAPFLLTKVPSETGYFDSSWHEETTRVQLGEQAHPSNRPLDFLTLPHDIWGYSYANFVPSFIIICTVIAVVHAYRVEALRFPALLFLSSLLFSKLSLLDFFIYPSRFHQLSVYCAFIVAPYGLAQLARWNRRPVFTLLALTFIIYLYQNLLIIDLNIWRSDEQMDITRIASLCRAAPELVEAECIYSNFVPVRFVKLLNRALIFLVTDCNAISKGCGASSNEQGRATTQIVWAGSLPADCWSLLDANTVRTSSNLTTGSLRAPTPAAGDG